MFEVFKKLGRQYPWRGYGFCCNPHAEFDRIGKLLIELQDNIVCKTEFRRVMATIKEALIAVNESIIQSRDVALQVATEAKDSVDRVGSDVQALIKKVDELNIEDPELTTIVENLTNNADTFKNATAKFQEVAQALKGVDDLYPGIIPAPGTGETGEDTTGGDTGSDTVDAGTGEDTTDDGTGSDEQQ